MKRLITTILMVTLIAGALSARQDEPLLSERDHEKMGKLFSDYFSARSEYDYKRMGKSFEALEKELAAKAKSKKLESLMMSLPDMRTIISAPIEPEKSVKKGIVKQFDFEEVLMSGPRQFSYYLWVPRDYNGKDATPVVLYLQPERMDENDLKKAVETIYPDSVREMAIVIAPIAPSDGGWMSNSGLMTAFFSLRQVVAGYRVDRLRLFLDGSEEAAGNVVDYIAKFPGSFSGAVARDMSQSPATTTLINAANTPMLLLSPPPGDTAKLMSDFADDAKASRVELVELVQPGKDATEEEVETIRAEALTRFIGETRKRVAPERFSFTTTSIEQNACYWLNLRRFDATDNKPITVEAEIDRATNEIHITTPPDVFAFTIFLNDAMVDMGKSIKVIHTQKWPKKADSDEPPEVKSTTRFEGTKPRSIEKTLQVWFDGSSGNQGEVYTNYIEIEVPE